MAWIKRLQRRLNSEHKQRGQSMIELALTFPILLLVLAGAVEIGMYYNTYMTLVDATREAARFASDQDYQNGDTNNQCPAPGVTSTLDFYKQAACLVIENMQRNITFDPTRDDIVVSVVQIKDGAIYKRFVDPAQPNPTEGEQGWSYCETVLTTGCNRATSLFTNAALQARLSQDPNYAAAPKAGLVIVEVYHVHHQFLGLIPPGFSFLPQEVMMHAYTIMPLPSAASTIPDD